jgi:hypothetical protein
MRGPKVRALRYEKYSGRRSGRLRGGLANAPVGATTFPLTSDISSTFLLDAQPLTCLWVAFPNLTRYIRKNISLSNDK